MVSVKYNGTLGNKMWQYASARIFCVNNNLTLNAEPVEHFINTNEKIIGKECNSHSKFIIPTLVIILSMGIFNVMKTLKSIKLIFVRCLN